MGFMYCNCYACRNYFTDCPGNDHPKSEMIWAQHKDGTFWWGETRKGAGRRVKICTGCRDELAEYGYAE